ncbi:MAG: prepilin peptidase [Clostridia bacterium]|nr:prepilin peptidase [Clostridia bacterium]
MGSHLAVEWQVFFGVFVFIFGLCVGSFLNVCIYRIPLEKSIAFPPSCCPGCGTRLKPLDLIPVISYIFLGGKCRYCQKKISIKYPLVELLTGITWLFIFLRYGLSIETLALIFLFTVLIPILFIDLEHMIIPDGLVLTGLIGGAALFIYHIAVKPFSLYQSSLWYAPLIGVVSASGILLVVALIGLAIYKNDGAMGMGDVKLFLPIGLFLGWKLALLSLFMSVMLGGILSIILLLFKVVDRKSAIPFGPFIILGTFIAANYGIQILNWYFSL